MPVLLKLKTYHWLQQIGVFKHDPLPSKAPNYCQVPYDEEIYLQNGYLIGATIRKFVTPYSESYQDLLKVRKIATLKSSQNWQIIEPYLLKIGCDAISAEDPKESEIQISTVKIAEILENLYDEYSPKQEQKAAVEKRIKCNYIDFQNFDSHKQLSAAQNSLEFVCIVLVRSLEIELGEALGLLIDKSKYLKKLVVQGSTKNEFESLKKLYEDITNVWPMLDQFLNINPSDLNKILQGFSQGVLSQSMDIIHATINLLSFVRQQQWFLSIGYYKLLSSSYIQCFYFTIERLSPDYELVLNEKLHLCITDKAQLFTILLNLTKILPKTIYCKEILKHMPVNYFYEQCFSVLSPQQVDSQPHHLVVRAKQLLVRLMIYFTDKIPHVYVQRITQTFKYQANRSYSDTYHTLALLFEILQALLHKQSPLIQKFFKICMKYLGSTFGETRHWIIDNLRSLYKNMGKYFPIGCMLTMYSLSSIAQADEFQLFDLITQDHTQLTVQQSTLILNDLTKYVQFQTHCQCFMTIINKFIQYHSKTAVAWGQSLYASLLTKMQNISIPPIKYDVLNPKLPSKNRVISSIGIKRKQMLKFREFESGKQLLEVLLNFKDKAFLNSYANSLNQAITSIQKQIGHKKKELVNLFKKIKEAARANAQKIQQSITMYEVVRNIVQSRNTAQQSRVEPIFNTQSDDSSKWVDSESRIIPEHELKPTVIEEQQQNEDNEFISQSYLDKNADISHAQSFSNSEYLFNNLLLPFTQQDTIQSTLIHYSNSILEQNEIIYISMIKQKYQPLLRQCYRIYQRIIDKQSQIDVICKEFLNALGLSRIINFNDAEQMLMNCKTQSSSNNQIIVQSLLLQIAFHAFGFKKNRRISVSCVSSLFTLLEENLTAQMQTNGQGQAIHQKFKSPFSINKNIQYEHKLSNKIQPNSPSLSYYVCFQSLSNIFHKAFGIYLMQPMSKLVNKFLSPSLQQGDESRSTNQGFGNIKDEPTEFELLQDFISGEKINQNEVHFTQDDQHQSKYRFRKQKKRLLTEQPNQPVLTGTSIIAKVVDNKQLRNKLSKRLKVLGDQMKKNERSKTISAQSPPHKDQ